MKKAKWIGLALAAPLLALSACSTVTSDAEGISIRHSAENTLLVQRQAERHCARFGKHALEVQRSPVDNSYLVQTVVTTFACVDKS